jgi:hypothetical protein
MSGIFPSVLEGKTVLELIQIEDAVRMLVQLGKDKSSNMEVSCGT